MRLREAQAALEIKLVLGAQMVQELPKGAKSWLGEEVTITVREAEGMNAGEGDSRTSIQNLE